MGITRNELYELYYDTISMAGSHLLSKDDDWIEGIIFEDFCTGVISFLHENSLDVLLETGYINKEIYRKSQKLRKLYIKIDNFLPELRNSQSIRTNEKWAKILKLLDELKILLDERQNDKSKEQIIIETPKRWSLASLFRFNRP